MIEFPKRQQIVDLFQKENGRCVSILMPTYEAGRKTNQNPIRFKNLISKAIEQLGDSSDEAASRLVDLAKLENDFEFWQHQSKALAIFVCKGFQTVVKLRQAVDEIVYVADQFYVKPLAAAACGSSRCYALTLSWEQARVFHCDDHEATEIENDLFPATMDELVLDRDDEKSLQLTSHRAHGQGSGPTDVAMYHGHGEGEQKIESDRNRYLVRVGRLVNELMYGEKQPLIVIATDEVAGHFTSAVDVDVEDVIQTSPDGIDDTQLSEKITEWNRNHSSKSDAAIEERLGTAIAQDQGSADLSDVVMTAANGRVETLLLRADEPFWGTFDRDKMQVNVANYESDKQTDLVNLAVRETLAAGGDVHRCIATDHEDPVAAIYRF